MEDKDVPVIVDNAAPRRFELPNNMDVGLGTRWRLDPVTPEMYRANDLGPFGLHEKNLMKSVRVVMMLRVNDAWTANLFWPLSATVIQINIIEHVGDEVPLDRLGLLLTGLSGRLSGGGLGG
jgi:hypothetical protein